MLDIRKELETLEILDSESFELYLSLVSNGEYIGSEYSEVHHILPRSLFPEYATTKQNLIRLKYDDHIEAHRLLYSAFNLRGLGIAYFTMCGKDPNNLLSKGDLNPAKRPDVRKKISDAKKGVPRPDMFGKKFFGADDDTIKEIKRKSSEANSGMVVVSDNNGNRFKISVNDPRYLSGELRSFNFGDTRPNSGSKRPEVMDAIMESRSKGYERFSYMSFDEMVDFLVHAHSIGKKIFGKKTPFSSNYSGYVKRTAFDPVILKNAVVQRLEKGSDS